MKHAIAFVGVIIFMFSLAPSGAFADSEYPDLSSNVPPYVQGVFSMFSSETGYSIGFTQFQAWNNNNLVGTSSNAGAPITYYDCLDVDFFFSYPTGIINRIVLFEFYLVGLYNIDYIEIYSTDTHKAASVCYFTQANNSLYVIAVGSTFDAYDNTLRIHFKEGSNSYQVGYVGLFGNVKTHANDSSASAQYNLVNWMYYGQLLTEATESSLDLSSISASATDISSSISTLESILRAARNGNTRYLYNNVSFTDPLLAIYTLDNSLSCTGYSYYYRDDSYVSSVNRNFTIALKFDWQNAMFPYFRVTLPLANLPSNFQYRDYDINIMFGVIAEDADDYNDFVSFNSYSDYCFFNVGTYNGRICLFVYAYYPTPVSQVTGANARYLYIRFKPTTSGLGTVQFAPPDFDTYNVWGLNGTSQVGSEWLQHIYFDKYLALLEKLTDQWASYPTGPSDPQDPNQTTNIYDVNIEFNTQVGDISVFENTYSQQLPTYDQSISDQYLVPVSNTYDFSDLNSTFNSIWQSSFQYDTDEEDNIVGVYGLGLYFIIPLVLLVLFALFRRITS